MNDLKTKFEKRTKQDAFSWGEQDDGSLGHCPECFLYGAQSVYPILQELVEALEELDCKTIGDGSIIRKEALSKLNDWLDGTNR